MARMVQQLVAATALLASCAQPVEQAGAPVDSRSEGSPPAAAAARPAGVEVGVGGSIRGVGESYQTTASGPFRVELGSLPRGAEERFRPSLPAAPVERPIPPEEVERRRREASSLAPAPGVRALGVGGGAPELLSGFESLDLGGTSGFVPPDPELAAGPGHLAAVVNSELAIYDKSGALLGGPVSLASLFSATPACNGIKFDPNVLYDEAEDRFFVGADGGGSSYCMAVSAGGDPTDAWLTYAFATEPSGLFFDYPHAGIGRDAIYVGANLFSGQFVEARVWAVQKAALYAGAPGPLVVSHTTGSNSTPQPVNLHGFAQGTWPSTGPHYILTDDAAFSGSRFGVWSWDEPFDGLPPVKLGEVDLDGPSAVVAGFPVLVPQNGAGLLESNDYRVQDAEFRNGFVWAVQTIGCNPGQGTVNCIRWVTIDPAAAGGPAVVDAGVLGSEGVHRIFADGAANHCGDLALGYTRSSSISFPSIWFTGRRANETSQTLQAESLLRSGDLAYQAFDGSPYRWGDYTGMTPDPDGLRFWYLGEYSKDLGAGSTGWGTYIGAFSYPGCPILAPSPTSLDLGAVEVGLAAPPGEIVLANRGDDLLALTGITLSDPARFSLDPGGGVSPCNSTMPAIPPGQSCTVAVGFHPDAQGEFAAVLQVDSPLEPNRRKIPLAGVGYDPCPYAASEVVSNAVEENGTLEVAACETVSIGPFQLGPDGSLAATAGIAVILLDGVVISGELAAEIDPFLVLP